MSLIKYRGTKRCAICGVYPGASFYAMGIWQKDKCLGVVCGLHREQFGNVETELLSGVH
jgi:hypothetical protein